MILTFKAPAFALLLLFTCSTLTASAQKKDEKIKGQFYYFKVWGFLKYNHPALASGRLNADSLFLTNLAAIDLTTGHQGIESIVGRLLQQLNAIQTGTLVIERPVANELIKNVDQTWFSKDTYFSSAIRKQLKSIYLHRYTSPDHYYYTEKHFGSKLPHEVPYAFADTAAIPYPYRLLTVAKIQAAIDYLYPHKYLMDNNWNELVKIFIPRFANAGDRLTFEKELLQLTAHLDDTHTLRFYKSMKNWKKILKVKYYPPFDYTLISEGTQVLVTRIIIPELCQEAGIQKGDVITKMNDLSVTERVRQLRGYLSVSNEHALYQRLNRYFDNLLFTTDSLRANLTYESEGKAYSTSIEWTSKPNDFKTLTTYVNEQMRPEAEGTALEYMAPDIVAFRSGETTRFLDNLPERQLESSMDSLFTIASRQKGLIFDMRKYPDWAGFFYLLYNRLGQNRNPFAQYFAVDKQHIGMFKLLTDTIEYYPPTAKPGYYKYVGKVIILVNGETRSAGEYYTMFLQQLFPQSVTLGEQSAGADGDEKELTLPGGYELPFSGNAIFYPDGTQAQRKGVKINTSLQPKLEDLINDKDALMEEAIRLIKQMN